MKNKETNKLKNKDETRQIITNTEYFLQQHTGSLDGHTPNPRQNVKTHNITLESLYKKTR